MDSNHDSRDNATSSTTYLHNGDDIGLFSSLGSFQQQWHNASSSSLAGVLGGGASSNGSATTLLHNSGSSPEAIALLSNSGGNHGLNVLDSNHDSSVLSDHSDTAPEVERPRKRVRQAIPSDKKDEKYWERRRKNNIAARRSRETKRQKVDEELQKAKDAIQENQKLKQEIEVLKAEINSLRRLLKDANMTLSLWIRARQTSEPGTSQLPPMLRNTTGNVPFVTFPVTSCS